jgi:hypothetical protein
VARIGDGRPLQIPFASVEDAIARQGDNKVGQFYDDLVATYPHATATDLAKYVLKSLGTAESVQKSGGVRTRYGNDVQAIAARVREARKRAGVPSQASKPRTGVDQAQAWATEVEAVARRQPDYLTALLQVLRQSGHLDS